MRISDWSSDVCSSDLRARGKEALDLKTGDYRATQRANLGSARAAKAGLRALVDFDDKGGQYAWGVLSRVLSYAADLVPEIADDILAVDRKSTRLNSSH